MKSLLQNQWARYVLVLLVGIGVGAIFYPSKTITEEKVREYEEKIVRLQEEKREAVSVVKGLLDEERKESKEYKEETNKQLSSLKQENISLKSKVKESRFKIVKPDGTIEEKWFKESETDIVSSTVTRIKTEYTKKVASIESKWKKIHEKRLREVKENFDKKIAESKESKEKEVFKKKTEINKRSFGVSVGVMSNKDYFSSINYDVYGPIFLDIHLQSDDAFDDKEAGVGFGIRF